MKLHLKIFFSFMLGVILLLSAIAVSIYSFQKQELVSALEEKIRITEQSINHVINSQQKSLVTSVKTIAKDWGLRSAIGQKNTNTIISALNNHRLRINAKEALFVNNSGAIVSTNDDIPAELNSLISLVVTNNKNDDYRAIVINNKYYQAVVSAVKAPQKIGWLLMVFKLDELEQAVSQVSNRNNVKIVVFEGITSSRLMFASHQLGTDERTYLLEYSASDSSKEFKQLATDNGNIIVRLSDFQQGSVFHIGVFGSTDEALLPLDAFWQYMGGLFVTFAMFALFLTYFAAKGITRPLQLLLANAQKLEAGDFSTEIDIRRKDEIGDLAIAFKSMQKAVFERETKVVESMHKLQHQAMHDSLTGLPNRRKLAEELELANEAVKNSGEHYHVCILDLDRFKIVNDISGHAAGDALLVLIAKILLKTVRPVDSVVRLGGDEFALILQGGSSNDALDICNQIRAQLEELVFRWENVTHRIGVSIGVLSVSEPVDNPTTILQRADAGCFIAKENGRNQVHQVIDTSETLDKKRDELRWVQRINNAVENDKLILFAQTIQPLQANENAEILEIFVRLRHFQTGKLITPCRFIPSVERHGLSAQIDRWVITQLLKVAPVYRDLFDDNRIFWVNISGASFGDEDFINFLEEIISQNLLPPGSLNFEITETAVIRNIEEASAVMLRLKRFGCRFTLEDFGSGLSSFNHLKLLPIDYLKIDSLFIKNICNDKIDRLFVKSIVDIAHEMDIGTIAEHVENQDILDEVTALGVDYGQGYQIGDPRELLPALVSIENQCQDQK